MDFIKQVSIGHLKAFRSAAFPYFGCLVPISPSFGKIRSTLIGETLSLRSTKTIIGILDHLVFTAPKILFVTDLQPSHSLSIRLKRGEVRLG
jgi:hypothetical protein